MAFSLMLIILGVIMFLLPFFVYVPILMVAAFFMGGANNILLIGIVMKKAIECFTCCIVPYLSITVGSNSECLRLWRGQRNEPYLHFIHMGDTLGLLFTPLLAMMVLSGKVGERGWEPLSGLEGVKIYFPIMGAIVLALVPPFLYFGLLSSSCGPRPEVKKGVTEKSQLSWRHYLMIALFSSMQGLISISWTLGIQIPLYAAYSHLHLSRVAGSSLSLFFRVAFIISRLIVALISVKIKAKVLIYPCLAVFTAPCLYIPYRGTELTAHELEVSVTVLGAGSGPLLTTTLLIFEDLLPLTPRVAGLLPMAEAILKKLLPILIGVMIERNPNDIFLIGVATTLTSVIYLLLEVFSKRINKMLEVQQ